MTACYLIVYDIASPKRLRRVAGICHDGGFRIQKSVFECVLRESDFTRLWARLCAAIDPAEDSLAAYPLCQACLKNIRSAGQPRRTVAHQTFFLF